MRDASGNLLWNASCKVYTSKSKIEDTGEEQFAFRKRSIAQKSLCGCSKRLPTIRSTARLGSALQLAVGFPKAEDFLLWFLWYKPKPVNPDEAPCPFCRVSYQRGPLKSVPLSSIASTSDTRRWCWCPRSDTACQLKGVVLLKSRNAHWMPLKIRWKVHS